MVGEGVLLVPLSLSPVGGDGENRIPYFA